MRRGCDLESERRESLDYDLEGGEHHAGVDGDDVGSFRNHDPAPDSPLHAGTRQEEFEISDDGEYGEDVDVFVLRGAYRAGLDVRVLVEGRVVDRTEHRLGAVDRIREQSSFELEEDLEARQDALADRDRLAQVLKREVPELRYFLREDVRTVHPVRGIQRVALIAHHPEFL